MLGRNHLHRPLGIAVALSLLAASPASAQRRVVVRQQDIRKNPDLYQQQARRASYRLKRAMVTGMRSLGVPKATLRSISAKMETLRDRALNRFHPPTAGAAADLKAAALTLADQSPLLRRELKPRDRERFAASLVDLAARHGTMMSGKAQPSIGARLILRALEQTTKRAVPALEALRTQERQTHGLARALGRYYHNRYTDGLRGLIRKLGKQSPDLLKTDTWHGWDGAAQQTTAALRQAGVSVGGGRYRYGRTIYPQVVEEMVSGNTPKRREAALLRHLSSNLYGQNVPVSGHAEQTRKLEDLGRNHAQFAEGARVMRIYSTELR